MLKDSNHISAVTLLILVLTLCVGMTALFWPGVGTWEVLQFAKQRSLPVMNDWKSPFVAYLYWASDDLFKSTGPILLLQQIILWSGLAMVLHALQTKTLRKVILFLLIVIIPPIWITSIFLWKEIWTLSLLSLSLGSTFIFLKNKRLIFAILMILSTTLIASTRQNAILLTIPAFYVVARMSADRISYVMGKGYKILFLLIFFILLIITFSTNWFLNKKDIQKCNIWQYSILWDLASISISENQMYIPDNFRKPGESGSLDNIRLYFSLYHSDPLFVNKNAPLKMYGTPWSGCGSQQPLRPLVEVWFQTILKHPKTYFYHRLSSIIYLLGIKDITKNKFGLFYYRIDSEFTDRVNQSKFFNYLCSTNNYSSMVLGFLGKGWIYFFVFYFSIFGIHSKHDPVKRTYLWLIWLSGIAYFMSFALIGSGAEMRYLSVFSLLGPIIISHSRCS
ncbi:MAG: hypothetical protein K8R67_12955 [Desulfobacteraceae bacterium]|nr:hypothetical protein [Desulfobacteraceae bacterium]